MLKTVKELKLELARIPDNMYCHPDTLKGYVYLPDPKTAFPEMTISSYTTDPYSARAKILKLENESKINIRVLETEHYCQICIDKEKKDDIN